MKIYGDYAFLLDRLSVRNQSQIQLSQNGMKIVEFADKFIEEQRAASKDQSVVSEEGMDYIREQLSDLGAGMKRAGITSGTADDRMMSFVTGYDMSLMDGLCRTYILQRLDSVDENGASHNLYRELSLQRQKETNGSENQDWPERMEDLAEAYASLHQKITEGYENGTREVWIRDYSTGEDFSGVELEMDGQAVRYRKLTKEEELHSLEQSADRLMKEKAEQYVKEEKAGRKEESLVKEARALLDKVREETEKQKKSFAKEPDTEGRMEIEAHNHRAETAVRGKRQAQYENYRKISRMVSDAHTILGNIRA